MSLDTLADFNRGIQHGNAIYPYSWTALYRNPRGVLRQFDPFRPALMHKCAEIDRARLKALIIHGLPDGDYSIEVVEGLGPPDEITIGCTNLVQFETGFSGVKAKISCPFFRYRYGDDVYSTEIDVQQRVWRALYEGGVETFRERV